MVVLTRLHYSAFVCFTLMALSAPLVTNSGSPCKNVAAAMAVLWACLCWVTSWRRSRSQNAMWPWGLPDATMGGPSDKERERERHWECMERARERVREHSGRETSTCTCSESERADWSPVLCEAHQRLIQSDVVNDDAAHCCADADHIHCGTLENTF